MIAPELVPQMTSGRIASRSKNTEDADVREATCSPATERQPDARHLPLTPTELTGGTTVTSPRSARASASDVPNCRVDDRARK